MKYKTCKVINQNFFLDELSIAQLQDIIVNLEERFIIYRFTENKTSHLALNPVLKSVLLPVAEDTSALFPAVKEKTALSASDMPKAEFNDLILIGLFSFVSGWESFYRSEGVIRKYVLKEGKTCFPGIDLVNILGALQVLGLFYADEDRLIPDRKRFDDFGLLSVRERMEYCAAAFFLYSESTNSLEILPPLYRGKVRELIYLIHDLIGTLKTGFIYPETTLIRMIEVQKKRTNMILDNKKLLDVLKKTGLVINGTVIDNKTDKSKSPFIAINSGSSILVYPEIEYADALKLTAFMNIKEIGAVVRFEIDKDSAIRAFDNNVSSDEIILLLERLSGGNVDNALIWNLKDWEKRHGEVSLKKGVILNLSEEHRYLTETNPLATLIVETFAPGLYFLSENAMDDATAALQKAGIDIIAKCKEKKESSVSSTNYFLSPSSISLINKTSPDTENISNNNPRPSRLTAKNVSDKANPCGNASEIKERFHSVLEKVQLSEQERMELSARIDRRLVICETQLKDVNIRYEKLEARHMDYTGKQNIARQAISQQSPVEVVWTNKGKEERIFGIPQALEKEGNELILVVEAMRIPLAKISLLRRIKKSIFER